MLTVLFVFDDTTLTAYTPSTINLIPIVSGPTIVCTPTNGSAQLPIRKGTYKIISTSGPTFTGPDAEGLVASGKDEPPDPTLVSRLNVASPGVSTATFQSFLVVPGARTEALA